MTPTDDGSIKMTLITIVIAFVLTLVFRAFVAEAFLIPTGSMAPTLLGEHLRYRSPQSGHSWASNASSVPTLPPGARAVVADPSTSLHIDTPVDGPRAGDRIFVLKFLGALFSPKRWDVVVFKNPEAPEENYIKRLVGLPGESVLLVDGDVFTRPADQPDAPWTIARKPGRIQDSVWRPIDASQWSPAEESLPGQSWESPWVGERLTRRQRDFRIESTGPALLRWDHDRFPIVDSEPYNEAPLLRFDDDEIEHPTESRSGTFPVSDLRLGLTIIPEEPVRVRAVIVTPGREYAGEAHTDERGAVLRILQRDARSGEWRSVAEKHVSDRAILRPRTPTRIETIHVDQRIELIINGRSRLAYEYAWDARERLLYAATLGPEGVRSIFEPDDRSSALNDPELFVSPAIRWEFLADQGKPINATLRRVTLDRDIYYRPARDEYGRPARSTHPASPANLDDGQYFVLGDNSASSRDGRLWEQPDAWVAATGLTPPGVVTSDLLIGKAFFVYFPAPLPARLLGQRHAIVPDVGRMRFIR